MRGSAVYTKHNSKIAYYRVIALCYFLFSVELLQNSWMEFYKTSYYDTLEEVQCTRTRTLF